MDEAECGKPQGTTQRCDYVGFPEAAAGRFFYCRELYEKAGRARFLRVKRCLEMIKDRLLRKCYELAGDLANSSSPKCLKSGGKWCKVFEKGCNVVYFRKEGCCVWQIWHFPARLTIPLTARDA